MMIDECRMTNGRKESPDFEATLLGLPVIFNLAVLLARLRGNGAVQSSCFAGHSPFVIRHSSFALPC
jgi:hypothetical protein